jgi:hypothetical protein
MLENKHEYFKDKLDYPAESKDTDYKAAIKFNEASDFAAKLAKHIIGFSNSLLLWLFLVIIVLGSSCSGVPGYRTFTGNQESFAISFSYPDSWQRSIISSYSNQTWTEITYQDYYVIISSEISNDESVNAAAVIQKYIDFGKMRPEFRIIRHDTINLGNQEAQDLYISYRLIFDSHEIVYYVDKPFFERIIVADYQGRTYTIHSSMDLEECESTNQVIDYMIETFRFISQD